MPVFAREKETPGGIEHEAVSEEADFLEPPVELEAPVANNR
jgi:hypothetical protein